MDPENKPLQASKAEAERLKEADALRKEGEALMLGGEFSEARPPPPLLLAARTLKEVRVRPGVDIECSSTT